MFYLCPFARLEVLNSRVYSFSSHMPGNDGFEGCLNFLRRMCAESRQGMTLWENKCFTYVDETSVTKAHDGKCQGKYYIIHVCIYCQCRLFLEHIVILGVLKVYPTHLTYIFYSVLFRYLTKPIDSFNFEEVGVVRISS